MLMVGHYSQARNKIRQGPNGSSINGSFILSRDCCTKELADGI